MSAKHTFVICAYKESAYLEECILSLKQQTVKSNIIMITSTPNNYIRELAEKYEIPLKVNEGEGGIVQDWNFGYAQCRTPYITIAHQDDVYFPEYAEHAVNMLESAKKPLIYFSDYCEIINTSCFDYMERAKEKFDVIFLDPPYNKNFIEPVLEGIVKNNLLNEDGIVVLESDGTDFHDDFDGLEMYRQRKYGRTYITVYKKNN